ncbi:hypothetical protein GCM10025867_23050 [Frondihabitans sucicola]|uniref:Winged helix DNA-binding domain-containing protein n=1 Tax=Frondihabitans sucicola TaxID=1268041 RepID=A0ABN6XYV5_9MICO|nr:winged helix DNA-binding domain-containing protein [Frondihabitans sucicola]BDZ50064.1 hypothetical protein GCM10025867_23050 [Frondihabitans sucicola]
MRSISDEERRRLTARRHHLGGDATSTEQVARSMIGLHATDPATVYLSTLVRARDLTIPEIQADFYERRSLVRWMAMRRTLFVFPVDAVPLVQAAISTPLAERLRRQLLRRLEVNGTEPPIDGDLDAWLSDVEAGAHAALAARGDATGLQLSADEPRLRTTIKPRAKSDLPQGVTSTLLVVMSAEGQIVRGRSSGAWTTRQHRWEPVERWYPGGVPALSTEAAQVELARVWLKAFGPAPVSDLEWYMGWTKSVVRRALAGLSVVDVDLGGVPGVVLDDPAALAELDLPPEPPVATLLPTLDPTPMGWKSRDWFFGIDPADVFDTNGNIGPTLWWGGEIVGGWAIAPSGEVRVSMVADRGSEALAACERAASELQDRLGGTVVTPVFRTRLEKSLAV